ncbi:MAG: hypothetical protein WBA73_01655 [Devosia sp.]
MTTDKRTIGVTPGNQRVLDTLMSTGTFATENEAAKFAFAVAAKRGVVAGTADGAGTKWNVGTFDHDQSLRLVVESIYEDVDEPYRLVEHLINAGLTLLDTGGDIPPDVFSEMFGDAKAQPQET